MAEPPWPRSAAQAAATRVAPWVGYCAGFWGLVVFMPVGLTYLAFFALALMLLAQGGRAARWRQLRDHALFLPLCVFVGWTLLVLVLQPTIYPETPSNLWHSMRIVLTFAMALALTRDEAAWAIRGFLLAAAFAVAVMVAGPWLHLSIDSPWRNQLQYSGNKSISNALLLATLAGSAVAVALARAGRRQRTVAIAVALGLLGVILFLLPSRSALLIALLLVPAAAIHQWRARWRRLLLALLVTALATSALLVLVPAMQTRLALGVAELQQASRGEVTQGSWNMRVQMIRHTVDMVLERPWTGWGIGAWNDQWRQRAPAAIARLNMPHNDLLWMGAQAGVPGALAWLAILWTACRVGWQRRDLTGRLAFVATLALLGAALVNSATRDAAIGLCLPWIAAIGVRLADRTTDAALPWNST